MAFDWGSAIGAAASLGSAYLGSKSAKSSGKDATKAADQANALQRYIYDDQRNLNMPAINAGNMARDRFMQMMGFGGVTSQSQPATPASPTAWFGNSSGRPVVNSSLYDSDQRYRSAWDQVAANHQNNYGRGYTGDSDRNALQQHMQQIYSASAPQQTQTPQLTQQGAFDAFRATPGYQFGLDEGNRSVQASAAARGGLNSGATLKALTRFGHGYADQQGYTPYMNRLAGIFGGAQTAVGAVGSAGQNYAGQVGNNLQNAAGARASSTYASNQAWQQGLGSAAGFLGDWYGNKYGGGG